jgi:hypothetical protein
MEMFKLVMVDLAILLPIKMGQFICVVVIKSLHDHVWAKLFWKELFEGPPIMAIVIHHDQIALLEFSWPHPFIKNIYFHELGLV